MDIYHYILIFGRAWKIICLLQLRAVFLIFYFILKWTPKCISFVFFKIPETPFVREWLMVLRGKRSCFLWRISGTLNAHNFFFCTKYLHIFMHSIFFSDNCIIMLAKCWYRILLWDLQISLPSTKKDSEDNLSFMVSSQREKNVKIKTTREP